MTEREIDTGPLDGRQREGARVGYMLSSEEHPAQTLVNNAKRAEQAGFTTALISDHFHPWTDNQGNSPFVWSVLGAIAQATRLLRVGTGVTCPIIRTHPAIIAHAAATAATLMPGRFFLGIGAGENLNEHVLGDAWPPPPVRLEMMEEAIEVIRLLWKGDVQSHRGRHYTVESARLYNLPTELPPIMIAAKGSGATKIAATLGDGLIATEPDEAQVRSFREAGGADKLVYGKLTVCWAATEEEARETAHRQWPNAGMGSYIQDLRLPQDFQEVATLVSEDDIAAEVLCSPDPARHIAALREFFDAGFDTVFVHQIGPDQEGFMRTYEREVLPTFAGIELVAGGARDADRN